jgi:hypothetical protein
MATRQYAATYASNVGWWENSQPSCIWRWRSLQKVIAQQSSAVHWV